MVYIVLVNYNGWYDTIQCIQSLFQIEHDPIHIVVVDNQSRDGSIDRFSSWLNDKFSIYIPANDPLRKYSVLSSMPIIKWKIIETASWKAIESGVKGQDISENNIIEVTILINNKNEGFAKGNNAAITWALKDKSCEYIWVLNNDTVIKPDSLKKLIDLYIDCREKKIKVGLVGSTLIYYHRPDLIQSSGGKLNKFLGTTYNQNGNKLVTSIDDLPPKYKVDFVVGASILCNRSFIEKVGKIPADYFLYYEDVEWSVKGSRYGYINFVCRDSIIYHKEGKSIGSNSNGANKSDFSDYYSLINRLKFIKKNYPCYLVITLIGFLGVMFNRIKRKKLNIFVNLLLKRPPVK